jgi:hypothetical protein
MVDPNGALYELPDQWSFCSSASISPILQTDNTSNCMSKCSIRYIARTSFLEGKDASEGAILGIVLSQINRFKQTGRLYSFKNMADWLGVDDTTDNYTNLYLNRFGGEDGGCINDVFASSSEFLALRFSAFATRGTCSDPSQHFGPVLARTLPDEDKLRVIAQNVDMIYEHSFDASVLSVLPEWTTLASQEISARGSDIDVSQGFYPAPNQQNSPPRIGSTYAYLLPGTLAPPVYFAPSEGHSRAVIVSDNFNPLPAAWQCPQDSTIRDRQGRAKPNYQLTDGSCKRCDPGSARFINGLVDIATCMEA